MKILCIDTSSKLCGVAILDDTTLIKKIELDNGLTHSESLMPLIDQILKECNLNLNDINLLVSDIGPGSFTGIRIGIATVKAFADSLNIPCIGISSLEVLAYNVSTDGLICSTIDCKNDNCYFALYELKNGNYKVLEPPTSESISNVLDLLNSKYENKNITFVGDGIKYLSMDDRFAMTNMAIEAGGKNGIFPVDEKTIEYLKEHGKKEWKVYEADEDAEYEWGVQAIDNGKRGGRFAFSSFNPLTSSVCENALLDLCVYTANGNIYYSVGDKTLLEIINTSGVQILRTIVNGNGAYSGLEKGVYLVSGIIGKLSRTFKLAL